MSEYRVDFYQQMRDRIRAWLEGKGKGFRYAEYLLAAPDLLHLLCRLALDPQVPVKDKAKLAGVIAYFVAPIDLLPEGVIGPGGYLEDVALAAYALNTMVNEIDPEIVRRHWAGNGDVLELIRRIVLVAHDMLGGRLWERLRAFWDRSQRGDQPQISTLEKDEPL